MRKNTRECITTEGITDWFTDQKLTRMLDNSFMIKLGNLIAVKNSKFMSSFTSGFFVIAVKKGG